MRYPASMPHALVSAGFMVVDDPAAAAGSHLVATVQAYPKQLLAFLGKPTKSVEDAISCVWILRKGWQIFTIYDWKQTSKFEKGLPTPAAFWSGTMPVNINIGSHARCAQEDILCLTTILRAHCGGSGCQCCGLQRCVCADFPFDPSDNMCKEPTIIL